MTPMCLTPFRSRRIRTLTVVSRCNCWPTRLHAFGVGQALSPYLIRHLAKQIGACNSWSELGGDVQLLDELDYVEAFRIGYGRLGALPDALEGWSARWRR